MAQDELADQLGQVLLEATREHLVSDVPIVLFLSGGADSACLGALAQRAGGANLAAMTVGFAETAFDETEGARQTAQALGLPFNVVTLGPRRVADGIDHAIWAMDQPTVDGLNSYWISKLAADAGYKVALSGQGADELFGGYTSLAWFRRFVNIGRWTSSLPASPFSFLLDRQNLPFRWRKMSYLFGGDAFVASQLAVKVLFLESDLHRLLPSALANGGRPSEAERHLSHWAAQVQDRGLLERLAYMDVEAHLQPRLLRDLDAMSMAHSLEVRPVFLDHRLVEFVLRVPAAVRMQQKRLLFEAAKRFVPERTAGGPGNPPQAHVYISPGAVDQPGLAANGRGNILRQANWLRPASCMRMPYKVCGAATSKIPEQVGWSRIWNLFVLVRWCEMMGVRP